MITILKLEKTIKKVENDRDEDIKYPIENEQIEELVIDISQILDLNMGVYFRSDSSGSDYWTQVEYYSKKLKKTIIFDYDWFHEFTSEQEFVHAIVKTEREIIEFEKTLSIN